MTYHGAVAEIVRLDDFEQARDRAVAALREGRIVVLPTDTVYGVVADAFNRLGTQRLFGAKRRDRQVPIGVVIRSPRQVNGLVSEVPDAAERLMASYWPGPLTLVFAQSEGLSWDLGESRGTVALRLPTDELLLAVCAEIGPLACTAARTIDGAVPHTVEEAQRQLGELVALYVDGGLRDQQPSTIVDVSRGNAEILRSGAIPARHIRQVALGEVGWGQRPADDEPDGTDEPEDPPSEPQEAR